ncbi:response regulator [Candidatus Poribacteria bacterium]|nr:response regulator [Candidatus Poribacteria bacterium]
MEDKAKYTVLILDDEPNVLTSLNALLDSETDYNVLAFASSQEALEAIQTHEIDLAIVDYLMPGDLNGIDFLLTLKQKQPFSIRMILTAYADKENVIKAINEVGLFKYLEKPWNNADLLETIREGLEKRALLKQLAEIQILDVNEMKR